MNMKKVIYLLLLLIAFFGSALFFTHFPFSGDSAVVFHVNSFAVTWRMIANLAIIAVLIGLFWISGRNFLVGVDAKHTTMISKK